LKILTLFVGGGCVPVRKGEGGIDKYMISNIK